VAPLGPNGAEKTTTIDMVLGLTRPDTGTVSVFGSSPAEAAKAGAVGAMLQTGSLVQFLSVRELLTMVASLYPHPFELNDVLRLTGTAELADRAKAKLSGGQTRSVRFAIALVADPDLLVLDERRRPSTSRGVVSSGPRSVRRPGRRTARRSGCRHDEQGAPRTRPRSTGGRWRSAGPG